MKKRALLCAALALSLSPALAQQPSPFADYQRMTRESAPVELFELDNLDALNFLVPGALGGGGTVSLMTDAQGKVY